MTDPWCVLCRGTVLSLPMYFSVVLCSVLLCNVLWYCARSSCVLFCGTVLSPTYYAT